MLFSVIIPVYNGERTIVRCLESVFGQGIGQEEFEVLCVDDCSPSSKGVELINAYASTPPEM